VLLFDQNKDLPSPCETIPIEHSSEALDAWIQSNQGASFVLAMGGTRGRERCELGRVLESKGLVAFEPLIHPRAWVAETATLGMGTQILAMAAISEFASIGRHCIVNTGPVVDHECLLGDGVHIMPGATLAGCVIVEDYATIGSGAVILPRIRIGCGAMIGAGSVVTRDVGAGETVVGVPARLLQPKNQV
jgi:sugar O-acyltransferase (sialic acid O-acetyltransferase NeuD family)